MAATAAQVLAALAALAGENEATLGSNNTTVNSYFNVKGVAYCGYSLMYACKKAGSDILDGCANAAYVPTLRAYLDKQGWRVSNSAAQAGDIFIYGSDQHTGFVYCGYSGLNVITLEGNASVYATLEKAKLSSAGTGAYEGIGYKKRYLNSSYKIYRPTYAAASASSTSSSSTSGTTTADYSSYIKKFQTWLNTNYKTGLDPDGSFGKLTKAAAVKAIQTYLNATYSAGLEPDGVFGPLTKAALKGHSIGKGSTGKLVYILQGMLYSRSYDPKGFDGIYGSGCYAAVKSYQTDNSLSVDGKAGPETFAKLCG